MIFYRFIASLLAPVLAAGLGWRLLRGRESLNDLAQRLGGGAGKPGAIWLHGASNGELTSARRLIEALLRQHPDRHLIVTCNTTTGRDLVAGWQLPHVTAQLAPLDYRWALARFRARWRPVVLVVLENELWPNRIVTAREPVVCIAARMSARSARRWGWLGGLARQVMGGITYLSAQDQASAKRFVALGFDAARLGPVMSLKQAVELPAPPAQELTALQRTFTRADTLLAASTHEGEEAVIIAAFTKARVARPALKLILAPRHPRRSAAIAVLIAQAGLPFATRSKAEAPDTATAVYLADTLGEMPLWYALAGVSFVGGSLVNKGGHTPFEPVQAASAVLHGPHVSNFEAAYVELDQAGAARQVSGADEMLAALIELESPDSQTALAQAAAAVILSGNSDNLTPTLAQIQRLVENAP